MISRQQGQTLIEFLLSSGLVVVVLAGAGWLLRVHWERSKCVYIVFEKTHARLNGVSRPTLQGPPVRLTESPDHVTGEATCGPLRQPEQVRLRKLKPGLW
jgi:hypothetical protein